MTAREFMLAGHRIRFKDDRTFGVDVESGMQTKYGLEDAEACADFIPVPSSEYLHREFYNFRPNDPGDRTGMAWNWWHKGGLYDRNVIERFRPRDRVTGEWIPGCCGAQWLEIGYLGWMEIDDARYDMGCAEGAD